MDELTALITKTMKDTWPDIGVTIWDPVEARQIVKDIVLPIEPPKVKEVRDIKVSGRSDNLIPIRIYTPIDHKNVSPGIIYFHGGGWVLGDLETHDHVIRELANFTGAVVFSVDYRLAPENPFPAGINDAQDAIKYVFNSASEYGVNADSIAIAGDSAGGNISAVMCILAKDGQIPMPVFQLLIYPVTDANFERPSYNQSDEFQFLTKAQMKWYWDNYIPNPADRINKLITPLNADDLSGLAPTYVATAENDPLLDEGKLYADKLISFGNKVTYRQFDGLPHGFINLYEYSFVARDATYEMFATVRDALWSN